MKIIAYSFFVSSLLLVSCQDNENSNPSHPSTGKLSLEITDSPIDNPNIKSCVVTIINAYADGVKLEGFSPQTLDLLSLQNGKTSSLGEFELENKNYTSLSLEMDFENTVQGESPGAYIELENGTKDAIALSESIIKLVSNFDIEMNTTKKLVLDIDLRKAIIDDATDMGAADYNFSNILGSNAGVRVIESENTGVIRGKSSKVTSTSQSTILYLYEKGQFDQNIELNSMGSSNLLFQNSVSSTSSDPDGNYELHFLPEGEYELYVAKYEMNMENKMEFSGLYSIDGVSDIENPKVVTIESGATVTVDITLEGILEL